MTRAAAAMWLAMIVGFGALCRVAQYAANTSLWHDEAFVALNVLHSGLRDLLRPPDWNEPSPPAFLLLEKMVVAAFGSSEYTLRLLPHLAGIAALVLFAGLARQVIQPAWDCWWAVALVALSDALIQQTNLVKHFTFDLLFSIAFVWLAMRAARQREPRRTLLVWGALGSIVPWLSYASLFGFVGTSLTLALARVRTWDRPTRQVYLAANIAVLVSFAFLLVPIRLQRTDVVASFWSEAFPNADSVAALVYWLVRTHIGLYHYVPQPVRALGPIFAIIGAVWCWRRGQRIELALLWAPVAIALVASSVHYWPFGGNQHMSFAAPAVTLTVGAGVAAVVPWLREWHPRAPAVTALVLLLPAFASSVYCLAVPRERHELRAVIEFMEQQRAPTDAVVVFDPATFAFYTGRDVRQQNPAPRPEERVWVITPSSKCGDLHADVRSVVDALSRRRARLAEKQAHGAAALLFGPEAHARDASQRPAPRVSQHREASWSAERQPLCRTAGAA